MKILINALSGNGDALMFSPALRILKEKNPSAVIDMLVMFRSVKEMYEHNPFLNEIFFIDFLKQSKFKSLSEVRKLKRYDYDYSVNVYPANRFEYNFLNSLLGAKKKIAHHYNHTNFTRAEYFNDILVNEVKDRHNVLQNVDLINQIINVNDNETGKLEIFVSDLHRQSASNWINKNISGKEMIVGFHPGSALLKNHIHKRWDKNKFAELGNILISKYNASILLFGNEFELNEEIKSKLNGNALIASDSDFMNSISRMEHCNLFVTNDTAFLHSAAALNIPTVAIFGYTNHKELLPWKSKHVVVRKDFDCSPCFYNSPKPAECIYKGEDEFKCIKLISVGDVYQSIKELLL